MPRLPDIDTLGRRPIPSAVPAIAGYKAGIAEAAQADYAGTLAEAGHGVIAAGKDLARAQIAADAKAASEARAEAEEAARDKLRPDRLLQLLGFDDRTVAAEGAFLRSLSRPAAAEPEAAEQPAVLTLPDAAMPAGLVPDANVTALPAADDAELFERRDSLAEGIPDDEARQTFLGQTQPLIERVLAQQAEQQGRDERNARRAGLNSAAAANIAAAQHIDDPALRTALIGNTAKHLRLAVARGAVAPEEARALGEQWRADYAERWLNGLPVREQFALLRDAHTGSGGGLGAMLDVDADDEVMVGGEGHDVLRGGAIDDDLSDVSAAADPEGEADDQVAGIPAIIGIAIGAARLLPAAIRAARAARAARRARGWFRKKRDDEHPALDSSDIPDEDLSLPDKRPSRPLPGDPSKTMEPGVPYEEIEKADPDDPFFFESKRDNQKFVRGSDGLTELGEAPRIKEDGIGENLPIRLGRREFDHIVTHIKIQDAKGLGYRDSWHMLEDVALNWKEIRQGHGGRIVLVKPNKLNSVVVVQVTRADGEDFYRIVTGGVRRIEQTELDEYLSKILFKR